MANYYTSDLHIGHANSLVFDERPFKDIKEMEEELIIRWNSKVGDKDTVYILGDLAYNATINQINSFLRRLNGRKVLVRGNHDYWLVREQDKLEGISEIHQLYQVNDEGRLVVLCHYPMCVWNQSHRGSIHLYGHVHKQEKAIKQYPYLADLPNAYNVGCMNWNFEPVTLKEIMTR